MNYPSNEYELIARIQKCLPPSVVNDNYELMIGDDAAVRVNRVVGERLIVTADISVENIHFTLDTMTFEEIGYKAMVSNLSDCAAMGAIPDSAFVQLVFPGQRVGAPARPVIAGGAKQSVERIYKGFARACGRWNFPVAGGDLSSGDAWVIGITLVGSIPPGERAVRRTGIVGGDVLWVTGMPGMSAAGLACLRRWGRKDVPAKHRRFVDAHISPVPRIDEARALAQSEHVHAMMDLSDGLSKDVGTLCYDNCLGFVFDQDAEPSAEMADLSGELGGDWRDWYYHGGEEYELLIACDPSFNPRDAGVSAIRLGRFTSESKSFPLVPGGWDHCQGGIGG